MAQWLQKIFGITRIELCPMSKPRWALKPVRGTLDLVNDLLVLTHLLTDQFWSLWITHRCKPWLIPVNLIMPLSRSWGDTTFVAHPLENLKLFSLGRNCFLLTKPIRSNSLIWGHNSLLDFVPNGIFAWSRRIWSSAMPTSLGMFFMSATTGRSCSSWSSIDLSGAFDNIAVDNRHPLSRVHNNPLFWDWLVTKFDKVSFSHNWFHQLFFLWCSGFGKVQPELPIAIVSCTPFWPCWFTNCFTLVPRTSCDIPLMHVFTCGTCARHSTICSSTPLWA